MTPSTLPADAMVERHLLKRRLMLWRFLGIMSFCLLLAALFFRFAPGTPTADEIHIARFSIEGLISDTDFQRDKLDEIAASDDAQALILHINSPGGTTSGAEVLFNAVRRVAEKKPVVVILKDVAASGGYLVATAGDHVVARRNTITGAIGVVFHWLQASELLNKIGVQSHIVASGPLKAQPNYFEPPSENALEATRLTVDDAFQWFVSLVAERRSLSREEALRIADGRVYTGGQALQIALVDQIGEEKDAVLWLDVTHDISADTEIRDWSPQPWEEVWKIGTNSWVLRLLGKEEVALKGLVSLWRPNPWNAP